MKFLRITFIGLVIALVLVPLSALAQDDEGAELELYASEDELLQVMLPASWFEPEIEEGLLFPGVLVVNSEDFAGRFAEETEAEPGDKAIVVFLLPLELLRMFGFEIPQDATLAELAQIVIGWFTAPGDDAPEEEVEALEVGEAEEVELDDGVTAVQAEVSALRQDGVYFVRQLDDDLIAVIFTVAAKGEFDDEQLELGRQAAATVSYAGTSEDLMASIFAAP